MTKKTTSLLILSILNLIITIAVLILCVPENIPFLLDNKEKIISLFSKWIMLLFSILPLLLVVFSIIIKHKKTQIILKIMSFWLIFDSVLYYFYFSLGSHLQIGETSEIPISIAVFLPISVIILVFSLKLKNSKFLSSPLAIFKEVRETEFIWHQAHIYARDVYFLSGLILFIISIIFSFFRFLVIEISVFILVLLIATLIVYIYSKTIYNKHIEMKTTKEKLDKKTQKQDENSENRPQKPKKKKKNKIVSDKSQM